MFRRTFGISSEALGRELGVSGPTVRKYAKRLGIDYSDGFDEKKKERLKTILKEKGKHQEEIQDNLTISQVGNLIGINQGTIRSYIEARGLGKKKDIGRRKAVLVLSKEEIEQIQEHYQGYKSKSPKQTLADLVSKSSYLIYVPGIKQLSGFSDVEKIRDFVQNSLLTGQIVVYKKVSAKIDVRLELEEA